MFFFELSNDEVDNALVEIFTTQESIAVGRQHFKLFLAIDISNLDNGHVKRTTTQVIHRNFAVAFFHFVHTKRQGSGGRFIDDAFDFQTSNAASIFGGLALCVVEVSGHGDNGFGHGFTEVIFSGFFHFAQNIGADLLC